MVSRPVRTSDLGIYVHVPYCRRRCPYCDFALTPVSEAPSKGFAEAAISEIERLAAGESIGGVDVSAATIGRPASTVFFGGGTPSLLDAADVSRILSAIDRRFPLAKDAEITLEANPEDAGSGRFASFRAAGATRLSLGVQSFDDRVLRSLGREHDAAQAADAIGAARAAGFAEIGVDLIFGTEHMTLESWRRDVARAIELGPTHVSCYGLTLERGTALTRAVAAGALTLPDGDAQADQYEAAVEMLGAAGHPRYEISNFAAPGHRSRHNLLYWRYQEWLGLGPSSHSFLRTVPDGRADAGGLRFWNGKNPFRYLVAKGPDRSGHELTTGRVAMGELVFTSMRLAEGLALDEFAAVFGAPAESIFRATFDKLVSHGLLVREPGRVRLTDRGFLLSDGVFAELVAARS